MAGIELPKVGESANDGKGEDLRVSSIMYNSNFAALVYFLTGGLKQSGNLDKPIPISSGGTNATTAASARTQLGLVIGSNNELLYGNNCISIYDSKFTDYGSISNKHSLSKKGLGHYTLTNVASFSNYGYSVSLPKDDLGNVLIGCAVTIDATTNVLSLKTYALKYVEGKFEIDNAAPMDIPINRCITLNVNKGL